MDSSYIRPFLDSTVNVFETMLQLKPEIGKPKTTKTIPSSSVFDVSGIIGLTGEVMGTVILGFPKATAEAVITKFIGMESDVTSDDFADAVGELVNMIAGSAKANFPHHGVSISCPSVIVGSGHKVVLPTDAVCISIPFKVPCGPFVVEVGLKLQKTTSATPEAACQATH